MPQAAVLKTPQPIQQAIVAQRALGATKSKIAKELGIDRETVARVLRQGLEKPQDATIATRMQQLIPKAYDVVEQGLTHDSVALDKRANIGLRLIELDHATKHEHTYVNIERFASIATLLPSDAAGPKQPQSQPGSLGPIAVSTTFFQELSKQPSKQPITLICNGETLQIMRCSGGGEPAAVARVIEVPSLPPSDEQENAER